MGPGGGGGLGRNPHPVYNYSRLREEHILNCKSTKDLQFTNDFVFKRREPNERAAMSFESYTQHMPTLQRTTFWSNYMSGLKGWIEASFYIFWAKQLWGNLSAVERPVEIREVSPFTQYRAVDVTMYDLIYGEEKVCVKSEYDAGYSRQSSIPHPYHVRAWVLQASAHWHSRQRSRKAILLRVNRKQM